MSKLNLLFITIVLLAVRTQGREVLDEEKLVDDAKKWIQETISEGIDKLEQAEENLRKTLTEALEDNRQQIQNEYNKNIAEFHTHRERFHPECFQKGLKHLNTLAVYDNLPDTNQILMRPFINQLADDTSTTTEAPEQSCVVAAISDVGSMIYKVAKYIASILVAMDDVLNGFHHCASAWYKYVTCVFSYISTAIGDVWHTLTGIKQLITDMEDLGADIKAQIARCTHPKSLLIRQQLMFAIKQAETCTSAKIN